MSDTNGNEQTPPATTTTPPAEGTTPNPADALFPPEGGQKPGEAEGKPPEGEEKPSEPEALTAESLTFPEGVQIDEPLRDEFIGVMNNAEMSPQERAQALVDLQAKAMNAASERGSQLWQDTQKQWAEEARADPEVGGDKLDANLAGISKLMDTYGTQELRDVFDLTGAGNNPHMIKFLSKISKELVTEGSPVAGTPAEGSRDPAKIMYPGMG